MGIFSNNTCLNSYFLPLKTKTVFPGSGPGSIEIPIRNLFLKHTVSFVLLDLFFFILRALELVIKNYL